MHVDQAAHIERLGDRGRVGLDDFDNPRWQGLRWDGARGVAAVHAGFFDVFHHSADQHLTGVVADGVDIDLGRVLQESVNQNGTLRRQATLATQRPEPGELCHRAGQMIAIVDDLHRPAAEHVARADQHGKADTVRNREGLIEVGCRSAGWLGDA